MFYLCKMRMRGQHRHFGILEHCDKTCARCRMGRKSSAVQMETALFGML